MNDRTDIVNHEPLPAELAARLRASENELDDEIVAQLALARQQALQAHSVSGNKPFNGFKHWQGWLVAASVTAIAVLVAVPAQSPETLNPEGVMAIDEGPNEDLDLYENLEFYEWLAAQEDLG